MLHLRLIAPAERTDEICDLLTDDPAVTNIVVLPKAAKRPEGDVLLCDVAREAANDVLDRLRDMGIERDGSIAVERVDLALSDAAKQAEDAAPGYSDDAVVWQELNRRTDDETSLTWSFMAFLALATQIAAIGVLMNSPILIVGAMVLGPEFGAVTAICFGLLNSKWRRIGRALRNLIIGFAAAIAITFLCALVSRWLGWVEPGMLDVNKETQFIVRPDRFSFIVALLAGAAGVLSMTAGKSSALVGVFISVTTVPAAGYIAVAAALSRWDDVIPSVITLGLNITGMIVAGTATLLFQWAVWKRYGFRLRTGRTR